MTWIDWTVVAAYLAYVVYDGVKRSRSTDTVRGYFLANRNLPWWAVGLSVMATQMSAITLVGTTGQGYADGIRFVQFYFGLPFAMVILCVTAVPFFHRADVYTAYEYLEKRFDGKTRTLTSFFFLLSRGLSCGVIIAAPAVILSIILGWNLELTVLAIGAPTILYTMLGGVQAVTWTDVKQMALVFTGLGVCIYVILAGMPPDISFLDALKIAGSSDHLRAIDFSFDLNETYTFWSGLLGGLFLMLSYFGCDQSQVQRYLTARSEGEGKVALLMSAFVKIPMQFVILMIGALVFVFYQFHAPPVIFHPQADARLRNSTEAVQFAQLEGRYQQAAAELRGAAAELTRSGYAAGSLLNYQLALSERERIRTQGIGMARRIEGHAFSDVNYIFPTFITHHMPVGVVGLMIAAIFAAAMSSISSELNSLSTASVMDFYRRFRPERSQSHYLRFSKLATAFWGILASIVAMYAAYLGSLIEVVNRFGSFFYGSLLGVFILAIAFRKSSANGAFFGLLAGMTSVAVVSLTTSVSFLWFNVVGAVTVVVTGLLISRVERG